MTGKCQTFVWIRGDWPVEDRVKLPVVNRVKLLTEKKQAGNASRKKQKKQKEVSKPSPVTTLPMTHDHRIQKIVVVLTRLIF